MNPAHAGAIVRYFAWMMRRGRRAAIWSTAALLGGTGCSLLHVTHTPAAVAVYWVALVAAQLLMVPWFLADSRADRRPQ